LIERRAIAAGIERVVGGSGMARPNAVPAGNAIQTVVLLRRHQNSKTPSIVRLRPLRHARSQQDAQI